MLAYVLEFALISIKKESFTLSKWYLISFSVASSYTGPKFGPNCYGHAERIVQSHDGRGIDSDI